MIEYYKLLGLNEGASQEEIQEAYERLSKELNPSENGNTAFFIEEYSKIQEAYKVLRNSSILSVTSKTSEASEALSSERVQSAVKKPIRKLKLQKGLSLAKVKNKKIIVIATGLIIIALIAYVLCLPKQYESSEIALTNDDVYSAFIRSDMKPLNGNVKGVGEFLNGLAEGKHTLIDKNGNTIAEGQYKKGKKIGFWKEWYPIKDGEWHFWFEKGLPKKEYNYSNGLLFGDYNSWYINGQLEKKGHFRNGFANGNWYYYDIKGKTLAHFNLDKTFWAENNLDVTRYRNGDLIPEVKNQKEWENLTTGAWCYYDNDPKNVKLYNWYAVNDPRGLAPEGFHIPSKDEIVFLKSLLVMGHKVSRYWDHFTSYEGRQVFGRNFQRLRLNPIPIVYRMAGISPYWIWNFDKDEYSVWSSSDIDNSESTSYVLEFNLDKCNIIYMMENMKYGFPVRCIKN